MSAFDPKRTLSVPSKRKADTAVFAAAKRFAILGAGIAVLNWFLGFQVIGGTARDAEHHSLTREMVELRMAPVFREANRVLAEGLGPRSSALVTVALDFACWRTLAKTLSTARAATLMADAVVAVSR